MRMYVGSLKCLLAYCTAWLLAEDYHPCAQTCPNAEGFQMWVRESPDHIAECSTDQHTVRVRPTAQPPSIPGSMLLVHTSRGIQ